MKELAGTLEERLKQGGRKTNKSFFPIPVIRKIQKEKIKVNQ
jgi:hypothetical protein